MSKAKWNSLFQKVEPEQVEEPIVRPGICSTCGNGSFELRIVKRRLLRKCKKCTEVIDPENMKVIRKGIVSTNE